MAKSTVGIGYGPLSDSIFIGKQNREKGMWTGDKEDITSDFLFVLEQYIPRSSSRTLECAGSKSMMLHVPLTKEGIEKSIAYLSKQLNEEEEF